MTEAIKQKITKGYEDVQSTANHCKASLIYITETDVRVDTYHYGKLQSCNHGI